MKLGGRFDNGLIMEQVSLIKIQNCFLKDFLIVSHNYGFSELFHYFLIPCLRLFEWKYFYNKVYFIIVCCLF